MQATEGLINGLMMCGLLVFLPTLLLSNPQYILLALMVDFGLFMLPTLVYTADVHQAWSIFRYVGHFYFLRLLTSLMFLVCFVKTLFGSDLSMSWFQPTRYTLAKEVA